ncbi:MAG: ATP-dependent Clp protease ATP-binding subunit [Tyzzerella sp.]|nr:ATP-dependent Clp protease ATP-binding subunit [Tyzzerella sp.]
MQKEFTAQAEKVLITAKNLARKWNHPYVGTEHLLLALKKEFTGVASQVLGMNGVEEEKVVKIIEELVAPVQDVKRKKIVFSPRLEFLLDNAMQEAVRQRSDKIGTEHMLLAMIKDADCVATRILVTLNVDLAKVQDDILETVGLDPKEYYEESYDGGRVPGGMLEQFATDLTTQASEGKLDPVVGREAEIERLMQVLSRRTKNNPCLIGEPGVGKTAIIEGLASRIAEGIVPEGMKEKRILTLDLSGMVAGSKYRGEFEERMKKLLREVKADSNVILFLDEIHTIIGAGGAEGALDAANILKPSMARGEIQLIGATTISEYRKHIEKDAALERRFQPITVEEPDTELCKKIMEGLKEKYESHHQVKIDEEALMAAIQLSERYINDRHLPDKAIDVLDEACSKVSLRGYKVPENLEKLEAMLQEMLARKEEEIKAGNFAEASLIHQEQEQVVKKIERLKKRFQAAQEKRELFVSEEDIASVVSAWTKIPVQKLTETEGTRLRKLEQTLHKRVIGQDEAVTAVAKAVKRGRVGIKSPNRPVGSFLFLGPTGVGKTELAKTLAEALFGKEDAMIRVDMSEYMEKHSVSKMIGSPPGYVGHDDGGQLSEKVRRNPYSVVLFDEIEKAHPDVFNILLQVLDDGHITDSQGRKVDFRNTVIIMTSNAGAKAIVEPKKLGFAAKEDAAEDYKKMKSNVMEEVKRLFRPEFLNRIDETIVFHSLNEEHMKKIVGLMCRELAERVNRQMNIKLTIRDSVKKLIVEKGTDKKYGARPLRRAIQNELEDKLAEAILDGDVKAGAEVIVSVSKDKIVFKEA